MKKDFIVNFLLLLLTLLVAIIVYMLGLWFCFAATLLFSLLIICRQFYLFDKYGEMLSAEKLTQRHSSEKAFELEAELHFYKLLMDEVDAAVLLSTESGCVEWKNRAAHELLCGAEVLPPEIIQAEAERRDELCFCGKEYLLSSSRVVMRNSTRKLIVLKNIHAAIEKSRVESWHKLVRVLTHEIMNSMTPIISLSSTLCDSMKPDDFGTDNDSVQNLRDGLQIINRRSSGLLSFVENYRKLTRIAVPVPERFRVVELFDDMRRLFTQPFVGFNLANIVDVCISADRAQIEQVMINIIKNAVEACEEKESALSENSDEDYVKDVLCSAKVQNIGSGEFLVITVKDNGLGILDSVLEQIFVPFFTTKQKGSGIGLSLSKQIIVNHGGDIEVLSQENVGSEVVCRLPI